MYLLETLHWQIKYCFLIEWYPIFQSHVFKRRISYANLKLLNISMPQSFINSATLYSNNEIYGESVGYSMENLMILMQIIIKSIMFWLPSIAIQKIFVNVLIFINNENNSFF